MKAQGARDKAQGRNGALDDRSSLRPEPCALRRVFTGISLVTIGES